MLPCNRAKICLTEQNMGKIESWTSQNAALRVPLLCRLRLGFFVTPKGRAFGATLLTRKIGTDVFMN